MYNAIAAIADYDQNLVLVALCQLLILNCVIQAFKIPMYLEFLLARHEKKIGKLFSFSSVVNNVVCL